jgi:hypothetical protein
MSNPPSFSASSDHQGLRGMSGLRKTESRELMEEKNTLFLQVNQKSNHCDGFPRVGVDVL